MWATGQLRGAEYRKKRESLLGGAGLPATNRRAVP
jgi:hypothetical protein